MDSYSSEGHNCVKHLCLYHLCLHMLSFLGGSFLECKIILTCGYFLDPIATVEEGISFQSCAPQNTRYAVHVKFLEPRMKKISFCIDCILKGQYFSYVWLNRIYGKLFFHFYPYATQKI